MPVRVRRRKMKMMMISSPGRKIQKTLRKLRTILLSFPNHLQDLLMTVQIPTRILDPTSLLKFPLVPVNNTANTLTTKSRSRNYHFDLKLKPELVPQWDRNRAHREGLSFKIPSLISLQSSLSSLNFPRTTIVYKCEALPPQINHLFVITPLLSN